MRELSFRNNIFLFFFALRTARGYWWQDPPTDGDSHATDGGWGFADVGLPMTNRRYSADWRSAEV